MVDVTVLMTVYNGMPFLTEAIDSILGQTYTDFEFLIINDCSTDNSREVILGYADPRIRLIDNSQNLKQTRSLNRGLELAQTELIARMDQDDISHPQRLEKQVRYLHDHPEIAVLGTNFRWIDAGGMVKGNKRLPENDFVLRFSQLVRCPFGGGSVAFRRSVVWDQLKGFNPLVDYSQDWEIWGRVLRDHKMANLPEFLLDVRRHEKASSESQRQLIVKENCLVFQSNLRFILGIETIPISWQSSINDLMANRITRPEVVVEITECLVDSFHQIYPEARSNRGIFSELSRHYLRVLYHCRGISPVFMAKSCCLLLMKIFRHWRDLQSR